MFCSVISSSKEDILRAVEDNDVIIISAPTGSGKSVLIPQYLYENGYDVIISEPRRIAAISLCDYVRSQRKDNTHIGFHTLLENSYSSSTGILYTTGSILHCKRYIESHNAILMLDEVHEWKMNTEVLLSWAKQELYDGCLGKLVIMSAVIDDELESYFEGFKIKVFKFDQNPHPRKIIQDRRYDMNDVWKIALEYEHENILIFLPGKKEIDHAVRNLRHVKKHSQIFGLYSYMTNYEQNKVFHRYNTQKIVVATNIAQTSITIPDLDIVIDCGLEKYPSYKHGVKSLELNNISQSDIIQRRGRVGRTKPGTYILASSVKEEIRPSKSIPYIYRTPLDTAIMELMYLGVKQFGSQFYHKFEHKDILPIQYKLNSLGILDDDLELTSLGKQLALMPYDVSISLPIILANEHNCLGDVILIQCILVHECKFIKYDINLYDERLLNGDEILECNNSDLIALLKIFKKCLKGEIPSDSKLIDWGIFNRIDALYGSLKASVKRYLNVSNIPREMSSDTESIKKCSLAFNIDGILIYDRVSKTYRHLMSGDDKIILSPTSICVQDDIFMIGTYQTYCMNTDRTSKRIYNATVCSGKDLMEIFPHAVRYGEPEESKKYRGYLEYPIYVRDVWVTSKYEKMNNDFIPTLKRRSKRSERIPNE